jgi:uncharacterized membrane protein YphA (DoxX/SURF4 family)
MNAEANSNKAVAVLTIRLILGFIFFFQGFGKVFNWGVEALYKMDFFFPTYQDYLPSVIIKATAYYTSYVELIAGFFLLLGLHTKYALYFLATVLVIVTFGHGLVDPIWDLQHVMYRLMLLVALLILPASWDKYSVDGFLNRNKN